MTSLALVYRPIVSLRIRHELAKCAAQKRTVVPCEAVTVTYLAIYLISVIGTSAKWITCVATEPKSRP